MAFKYKSLTTPLFRAFSQTPSISGFISSLRTSVAGPKLGNLECLTGSRCLIHTTSPREADDVGTSASMAFVRDIIDSEGRNNLDFIQPRPSTEASDIVHIKIFKNNTFVTITDSKGNKKAGASSGSLENMKGGKASKYATEATAEHVGRVARNLGLKSVVMRVNGFTHFKKKKQAILSWREGYTFGRGDKSPVSYIEDTTRRPHNGCRQRKRRRV
ncbi:hypothetical protein vseg_015786 [Gypsophila vaccaria]